MNNLKKAFAEMRKEGLFARQKWEDCTSCGIAALPTKGTAKLGGWVFYHKQDAQKLKEFGGVMLAFGIFPRKGESKERQLQREHWLAGTIMDTLEENGFATHWTGDVNERIFVAGRIQ